MSSPYNEADLDLVEVTCGNCGNRSDTPYDAAHMMNDAICGQCGETGKFGITADPSPRKNEILAKVEK